MTDTKRTQRNDEKSGGRYLWLTKYEPQTSTDRKIEDSADSMKNFPRAFIPMDELDEPLSHE